MLSHPFLAATPTAPVFAGIPVFFMFVNCPNFSIVMLLQLLGK